LKYLNVARFLLFFTPLSALATWRALLLWRGKVSLFSEAHLVQGTSFFDVVRRYQASVPAIAVSFWSFIPAAIFTHYGEVEKNRSLRTFFEIVQWPGWFVAVAFFLLSLAIQMFGAPNRLIPPPMRIGKTFNRP
jgi:hypothetical protein